MAQNTMGTPGVYVGRGRDEEPVEAGEYLDDSPQSVVETERRSARPSSAPPGEPDIEGDFDAEFYIELDDEEDPEADDGQ